jgi:hypothetical protein
MMSKIRNIDRRIIYAILLVSLAFPIFAPPGLPFAVGNPARNAYAAIDALEPGSLVVLSFDYAPTSADEINPQAMAVMRHLFEQKRGVRVVTLGFWPSGPIFAEINFRALEAEGVTDGLVYGEDYANFGYIAGAENAMAALATDPTDAFRRDREGNRTADLPIMQGVATGSDIDLLVHFGSGTPGVPEYIRQLVDPYGVPMVAGLAAVSVAGSIPYYQAGQVIGYFNGLRGAAEYEQLYGVAGPGTSAMDSFSFGHLTIIAFVLIGNITYFLDPDRKKRK